MQMIEQYAYKVGPINASVTWGHINPKPDFVSAWDAAKNAYDASPCRGKAFCTLNRQEQVEIVRKYVSREV